MRSKMHATLNLDAGFGQFGDSLDYKVSKFPAGEMYFQCVVPWDVSTVRINII